MSEKILLEATAVFLLEGDGVWLSKKPETKEGEKHKPGAGCLNGYGGGIDPGDNLDEFLAAIRETEEESGVKLAREHLKKRAVMDFHNERVDGGEFTCRVHTFVARGWSGKPQTTGEMEQPTLFPIKLVPYSRMMPADQFWLPHILLGKFIYGEAWHGPKQAYLTVRGCVTRTVSPQYLLGLRPQA